MPEIEVPDDRRTPPPIPGDGLRIAALDIGSNSVRLVVAEVLPSGGYRVLDEERENTRLASSLAETGELGPDAVEQTIQALRRFQSIASGYGVEELRAIATSAVRDAGNGGQFCERVATELGLGIDVIPSEEEARLAFLSVARAFDISGREVAVADIGGGSTEIVVASSGIVDRIYATRLGAVRVAEACQVTDKCSPEMLEKLDRHIDKQLKESIGKPAFHPSILFGTGGTFTAMATMISAASELNEKPVWGLRASRAEVRHLISDLAKMSLDRRRKVSGLNPKRADIIVAGLTVIERIMRYFRINTVQVHTRGVRDGLLLTMLRSYPQQSPRDVDQNAAIERFAEKCGVDLEHAKQVARLARSLWEQLTEPLGLNPDDRELIGAGALLANVGYLINFERHHKHSYHLIMNSDLPGVDPDTLRILANVARYHRGAVPKEKHDNFAALDDDQKDRVAKMSAILRLALALDRTHQQDVQAIDVNASRDEVDVTIKADTDPEIAIWAAERKVQLFESVFDRKIHFYAVE